MLDTGRELVTKNVLFERILYDKKIYMELEIDKDDEVFKIGRLRIIDNKPSAIHISYLAKSRFKDIAKDGKSIESIFSYTNQMDILSLRLVKVLLAFLFQQLQNEKF